MASFFRNIIINSHWSIIANTFLRGLNLLAKFLLVIFLAKHSNAEVVGVYSVFVTIVTIGIYVLGFEFYAYSHRDFLTEKFFTFSELIKNQLVLHFVCYLFFLPIAIISYYYFFGKLNLLYFTSILILEHLNQEIYRLLVTKNRTFLATLSSFIRGGVWIYCLIAITYLNKSSVSISSLYLYWLMAELFCFFVSVSFLNTLGLDFKSKINFNWISNGIKVSTIFFLIGIIQKVIEYSERLYLQKIINNKAAGIYFFFYNISYFPYVFFTSVLFIQFLPKILSGFSVSPVRFHYEKKLFLKFTLIYSFSLCCLSIILYFYIINFYLTSEYLAQRTVYWLLLLANIFSIFIDFQYIEFYVRKMERHILLSLILILPLHIFLNFEFITRWELKGAAYAKIITLVALILLRWNFTRKAEF